MARMPQKEHSMDLYKSIVQIKDVDECFRFFHDLCSVTELYALEQRFDVAKLLHAGQVYTDIMEKTRASSATISRVNRTLNYGQDGLNELLDRIREEENNA